MEYDNMKLVIPQNVRNVMEEKLILEEHLKEVIFNAEKTGRKIIHAKNNHITAYLKPKLLPIG